MILTNRFLEINSLMREGCARICRSCLESSVHMNGFLQMPEYFFIGQNLQQLKMLGMNLLRRTLHVFAKSILQSILFCSPSLTFRTRQSSTLHCPIWPYCPKFAWFAYMEDSLANCISNPLSRAGESECSKKMMIHR